MGEKIKWGIAGLGNIARKFAADLKLVSEAKLIGVASTDKSRAQAFRKNLRDKKLMIIMKIYIMILRLRSFILPA